MRLRPSSCCSQNLAPASGPNASCRRCARPLRWCGCSVFPAVGATDRVAAAVRPPARRGIAWHHGRKSAPAASWSTHDAWRWIGLTANGYHEDLLLSSAAPQVRRRDGQRIAIHAPRTAQAEAWTRCAKDSVITHSSLADRDQSCGAQPRPACGVTLLAVDTCPTDTGPVDAVLWDCDPRDLADESRVSDVRRACGTAPVLAVCGFPRPDDVQSALRHGIAAVLAKPLLSVDFEWHVSRLVGALGQR